MMASPILAATYKNFWCTHFDYYSCSFLQVLVGLLWIMSKAVCLGRKIVDFWSQWKNMTMAGLQLVEVLLSAIITASWNYIGRSIQYSKVRFFPSQSDFQLLARTHALESVWSLGVGWQRAAWYFASFSTISMSSGAFSWWRLQGYYLDQISSLDYSIARRRILPRYWIATQRFSFIL